MSLDLGKIPPYILEDLQERGHGASKVSQMTAAEAFDEFCIWQGLIGFGPTLRGAYDALKNAETGQ